MGLGELCREPLKLHARLVKVCRHPLRWKVWTKISLAGDGPLGTLEAR